MAHLNQRLSRRALERRYEMRWLRDRVRCRAEILPWRIAPQSASLEQFALIQMNMGREVCRRLREADSRLFSARMGMPDADRGHIFLAD